MSIVPALVDGPVTVHLGDAREVLRHLPAASVHCVVTSPPYWGLRDYGCEPMVWGGDPACDHRWERTALQVERGAGNWTQAANGDELQTGRHRTRYRGDVEAARSNNEFAEVTTGTCPQCGAWLGSLGLEPTPELYVDHLVEVAREIRRVLRPDGTLWLNLGDSYTSDIKGSGGVGASTLASWGRVTEAGIGRSQTRQRMQHHRVQHGLKAKDLVGIPWRAALALQADGWWLRSDVIWSKPNPMPESVADRPTRAHEYLFLLSPSHRYFYDADAVREPARDWSQPGRVKRDEGWSMRNGYPGQADGRQRGFKELDFSDRGRNKRSVWEIACQPYGEEHFATFPEALVLPCVEAGTSEHGCCPDCGAPWRRILERPHRGRWDDGSSANSNTTKVNRNHGKDAVSTATTARWEPTCEHDRRPLLAPTVLDPFAGSGTTLAVARRLGRRAIGIEVQPSYLPLIEKRIRAAALPLLEAIDEAS